MSQYTVAPGRCVCLPGGVLLKQGSRIPDNTPGDNIREWLQTGFIRRAGGPVEVDAKQGVVTTEGEVTQQSGTTPVSQPGKFVRDPNELQGLSLEELNTMLVDLDSAPADTVEEAIGLLSADLTS